MLEKRRFMLEKPFTRHGAASQTDGLGDRQMASEPPFADFAGSRFSEAPFIVQHCRQAVAPSGDFVPEARLILTPTLRTSGLWNSLPPEEFKDLILLLTFLTPNGWFRPTLPELADAMNTSQKAAHMRLKRLTARQWHGGPLVVTLPRQDGLDAYAPRRYLLGRFGYEEDIPAAEEMGQALLTEKAAGREAVIAHSRARYARTRQEVEAEIRQRMGWGPPAFEGDDPDTAARKGALYERMTALGMTKEQALGLLARFPVERVERQVGWIGSRNARDPGRYLAAAIENDYDAPPGARGETDGQ
jgi:hypothetical protein